MDEEAQEKRLDALHETLANTVKAMANGKLELIQFVSIVYKMGYLAGVDRLPVDKEMKDAAVAGLDILAVEVEKEDKKDA